jgi:hypothetical protein
MSIRYLMTLLLILAMGVEERVEARSTLTARFSEEGIAGPEVGHQVLLYLHFFPGDGEAIVDARVRLDVDDSELRGCRSTLGKVQQKGAELEVSYRQKPLAHESVDTLYIELVPGKNRAAIRGTAEIFSSLDGGRESAHSAAMGLAIRPPLELEVEVAPQRVFLGERVDLQLVVHNVDGWERAIDEMTWEWPDGLILLKGANSIRWDDGLQVGERDTLSLQVFVESIGEDGLALSGRANTQGVSGSPLPEAVLRVSALPEVALSAGDDLLQVGQVAELTYEWLNRSDKKIVLDELRLEIGDAFDRVTASGQGEPRVDREDGRNAVLLEGVELEPGSRMSIELEVRPLRSGPFNLRGFARPAGRRESIPLQGDTEIRVVLGLGSGKVEKGRADAQTDIQVVSRALSGPLQEKLAELPLPPGAQIYLQAEEKGSQNWIIEDALMAALKKQGMEIRLGQPKSEERTTRILHYRIVEARVVYSPLRRGWKLWGGQRQRQVFGDLFLRLAQADGQVVWSGRIKAYDRDQVAAGDAERLGAGEVVKRTMVAPDNKWVERGLSASIISSLFYIFFIL